MTHRCPTCGTTFPHMPEKTPVDQLHNGDKVRAVKGGPIGTVIDADRLGWTLAQYPSKHGDGVMPYKHGEDSLYVVQR